MPQSHHQLLKNPIILALDVDTYQDVDKFLSEVGDIVGAIKLGPRLVYRYGAELVQKCAQRTSVFVDNKYFDIPTTMLSAIRASFEAGATLATVHALSGAEALVQLAQLETELNKIRPFKILAVTILTSWNERSFPANFKAVPVSEHVVQLAQLVYQSGLSGLVCSGHELDLLENFDLFKVTPGIRLNESSAGDQKRVMNPQTAIKAGASALVIGRPILESTNPRKTVEDILGSL